MRFAIPLVLLIALGCNDGLTPPPEVVPGMGGVIRFAPGSWPSADSLAGLWLFASINYPVDSSRVIEGVLFEPRTIFLYPSLTQSLPFYIDSVQFRFDLPPGTYRYVGVIQQAKPELFVKNFRVVGMLEDPAHPGSPLTVTVREGMFLGGYMIVADFNYLPLQPF